MWASDLLLIAQHLATGVISSRKGRPREVELRRAVSATYYALFHTLARCGADLLVGRTHQYGRQLTWQQAYRGLDHGETRQRCENQKRVAEFPPAIQDFAAAFVRLQQARHHADYDPLATFSRSTVLQWIEEADNTVSGFNEVAPKHRKAFAAYVLLKNRGRAAGQSPTVQERRPGRPAKAGSTSTRTD